ncbi:MAG: glycosyltransferase family 4 protein [Fidelibacterota bacterium]
MKIALITPFLPYKNVPHAGGRYTYNILKNISQQNQVTLVTRLTRGEAKHITEISGMCEKIITTFISENPKPYLKIVLKVWSYFLLYRSINKTIKQTKYDIIQFEYSETAFFMKKIGNSITILNMHDVVSRRILVERNLAGNFIKKFADMIAYRIIFNLERKAVGKIDQALVRSNQEKKFVEDKYQSTKVSVMPLVVDSIPDKTRSDPKKPTILFTGAFNRPYNEIAALHLIEKIFIPLKNDIKDLQLILAGNKPNKKLIQISKRDSSITIMGFVENLYDQYLKSTLFVSPIYTGGGMIYKNMEAMNCGLPVITTEQANEAIGGKSDKHLLIANNPDEFIKEIKRLLGDNRFREMIGVGGMKFVQEKYSSTLIFKDYSDLISNLIAGTKAKNE